MKTNQVLTRKMGEFDVAQRTSDGMFNATVLLKQWNSFSGMKKELGDFFENKSTKEFIETIKEKENLNKGNSPYLKSRGKNGGTWMHPLLFIDFAMWLNPSFKYDVLRFVQDELIKYRNEAGDSYKQLASSISKIVKREDAAKAITSIARAMNYVVYNDHKPQLRNKKADESSLKELVELQKDICKLINLGFVKSFEELRDFLRKLWTSKWQPNI